MSDLGDALHRMAESHEPGMAGESLANVDAYDRYAAHFGVTRMEAKSRLFHITYGAAQIDLNQFVDDLIASEEIRG